MGEGNRSRSGEKWREKQSKVRRVPPQHTKVQTQKKEERDRKIETLGNGVCVCANPGLDVVHRACELSKEPAEDGQL